MAFLKNLGKHFLKIYFYEKAKLEHLKLEMSKNV